MKQLFFYILLVFVAVSYSQNKFGYTENGLAPESMLIEIGKSSKEHLYNKTLDWIKIYYENPAAAIDTLSKNDFIRLTGTKENLINMGKQYYHIKYSIQVGFEEGHYTFQPVKIESKLNSKYDMGWQDFDLTNGTLFFEKGIIIRKTKSYVNLIPAMLNELHNNLKNHLQSN